MTFKVKDLMINVVAGGGGGGGAYLPADDGPIPTPVTPHTPIISVAAISTQFKIAASLVKDAFKGKTGLAIAEDIARAGESVREGSAVFGGLLAKLDRVAIGAAAVAHGGGAAMPNPDCGGTSLETIPTPLTPVVLEARTVLTRSQIPAIKQQLAQVLVALEKAEAELAPSGRNIGLVRGQLEGALAEVKV